MDCCVIGIGTFGYNVATTLARHGVKVLAVDSDINAIEHIQDKVTSALCIKVVDEESLKEIGIEGIDVVVIAMGDNFEESILIAAILKRKFHIQMVVCRSINTQHKEILELIGADYVVLPEQEAGIRLADKLSIRYSNITRLTAHFSIVYMKTHKKWIGKNVNDISLLQNNDITILGKRQAEDIQTISSDYILEKDDILVLYGNNDNLDTIIE